MATLPRLPRTDVALAAFVALIGVVDAFTNHELVPRGAVLVCGSIAGGALAWRRAAPLGATVVATAACTVQAVAGVPLDEPIVPLLAPIVLAYTLASYAPVRRAVLGSALIAVSVGVQSAVQGRGVDNFLFASIVVGAMWAMGWTVRRRTAQAVASELAAERLRAERDERERRAARAERARIARELHDVIAHSLSVMVVQAGAAAEVVRRDPDRAADAIHLVERTGREALSEMAGLLGVLREGGEEAGLEPQPGIGDVERLVEQWRSAGLAVDLTVEGERRPLAPGVELAVYRIVQEALTNTRKHAGRVPASVRLRYGPDAVTVEVADPGGTATNGAGGGHGLVGMRERVALYGGQLRTGRSPGGGFTVHALIPVRAAE